MPPLHTEIVPPPPVTLEGELNNLLYSCDRVEEQLRRAYDCWRNDPAPEGKVTYTDLFTIETDMKRLKANVLRTLNQITNGTTNRITA